MLENQKGFTLTEVMLFLAVSGFLIMIAFAGLSGRINRVRFADSMRNLESFFESEESKVRNGVFGPIPGDCNGGAVVSGECVLLGRRITFTNVPPDSSIARIDNIVGERLRTNSAVPTTINDALNASNLTYSSASTYNLDWGVRLINSTGSNMVGYIRDPRASVILPFTGDPPGISTSTTLCFSDPDNNNKATITFSPNAQGVDLRFEDC
ncbi:prepilin-type N-terminal cleavage/methylation domain-containing protein [Candidatus Saccharibacteria bacterium CPR2]|nr:prepilin-type N-terminal cleavage/methylation domain-containing protein [Candidatus Saccharibacteria bacterium CPR2]